MNDSTSPDADAADSAPSQAQVVAVVGGGITGLAAACRLRELMPGVQLRLLEAQPRLGGVLRTERRGGYLLEQSADNFITDTPWGVDFCQRLGIADELLPTTAGNRRAGVVSRGRIEPLPAGFALLAPSQLGPLFGSRLLSPWGKLRVACEYFVPRRREQGDESFASFARRRLGREAYERIAQPLVSGIYTADPERLSMQAALARFVDMERSDRSLIRAARRLQNLAATDGRRRTPDAAAAPGPSTAVASGPRYSLFVAPREGLQSLVDAAARQLPDHAVQLSAEVQRIVPPTTGDRGQRWNITWRTAGNTDVQHLAADAVLVAVPSWSAARLIEPFDAPLAGELSGIDYAGCTIALLGCRAEQIERPLEGFGFVVPEVERRSILACSYASAKFPDRAPAGQVLLRVFLGGACHPELNDLSTPQIRELVLGELGQLLGLRGAPELFEVVRWSQAMPQYYLGHKDRVARIERATDRWPTLALAGNAYEGVGIPHCIRSGEAAARRIADALL